MGEGIVFLLGGYVASQCNIYELSEHTKYFVILKLLNFTSKMLIGFRHTG